jgi:hypothetical protein
MPLDPRAPATQNLMTALRVASDRIVEVERHYSEEFQHRTQIQLELRAALGREVRLRDEVWFWRWAAIGVTAVCVGLVIGMFAG